MSDYTTVNSISLSAPGGGEGRGEVGDSRAPALARLTLPSLCDGSLPLPPEGRRGARTLSKAKDAGPLYRPPFRRVSADRLARRHPQLLSAAARGAESGARQAPAAGGTGRLCAGR